MIRRTWARVTRGLLASAAARSSAAEGRASKALDELEAEGAAINFQSVAKRGSVSPGFLYGRPVFGRGSRPPVPARRVEERLPACTRLAQMPAFKFYLRPRSGESRSWRVMFAS
jgi:hypothetical protein